MWKTLTGSGHMFQMCYAIQKLIWMLVHDRVTHVTAIELALYRDFKWWTFTNLCSHVLNVRLASSWHNAIAKVNGITDSYLFQILVRLTFWNGTRIFCTNLKRNILKKKTRVKKSQMNYNLKRREYTLAWRFQLQHPEILTDISSFHFTLGNATSHSKFCVDES